MRCYRLLTQLSYQLNKSIKLWVVNNSGETGEFIGTHDLFKFDLGIVSVFVPAEPEVTSRLEFFRERVAFRVRGDSAVLLSPSGRRSVPLGLATQGEDTNTT